MRRVVLDTNVIISGLINRQGAPGQVLALQRALVFQQVISAALLHELRRVLGRPHIARRIPWASPDVATFLADMPNVAQLVEPERELDVIRDPADNRLLEAALAGQADYIVTGDQDLLALGEYEGVHILTPADFLLALASPG